MAKRKTRKKVPLANSSGKTVVKVTNVLVAGELKGTTRDAAGNPKNGFVAIDYISLEDFNKEFAEFKASYPNASLQKGAHKITTGMNEILGNGNNMLYCLHRLNKTVLLSNLVLLIPL